MGVGAIYLALALKFVWEQHAVHRRVFSKPSWWP